MRESIVLVLFLSQLNVDVIASVCINIVVFNIYYRRTNCYASAGVRLYYYGSRRAENTSDDFTDFSHYYTYRFFLPAL